MSDASRPPGRDDFLFPDIEPHVTGRLPVDARHSLYWEECGRPDGMPIVFLHGGPGGGSLPHHRRFFDPDRWRIILFDQRGAGRSTPFAEIADNTTWHLVADLERLRIHLGIERWALFGGSWGSTLALAYAQTWPQRVLGLVLRGIFLGTPAEIEWFLYGMRHFFPEAWERFAHYLPAAERNDLLTSYYRRLTHPDPAVHVPAAQHWDLYEGSCLTLIPANDPLPSDNDTASLAIARIEAHYFMHATFLGDNELLGNLHRIRHLPATIVQGRYDVICPPATAAALARAWPEAGYIVVADAGHSVREPGIARALVAAVTRLYERLSA
jgi:proline iminopeptidase